MRANCWKPDQDAILIKYWDTHSSKRIADHMGKTKKSIESRAFRLKLGPKEGIKPGKALIFRIKSKTKPIQPQRLDKNKIFHDDTRLGYRLIDLGSDQCRWPVNEGLFCGDKVEDGKSYCSCHYRHSVISPKIEGLKEPIDNRQSPVLLQFQARVRRQIAPHYSPLGRMAS